MYDFYPPLHKRLIPLLRLYVWQWYCITFLIAIGAVGIWYSFFYRQISARLLRYSAIEYSSTDLEQLQEKLAIAQKKYSAFGHTQYDVSSLSLFFYKKALERNIVVISAHTDQGIHSRNSFALNLHGSYENLVAFLDDLLQAHYPFYFESWMMQPREGSLIHMELHGYLATVGNDEK